MAKETPRRSVGPEDDEERAGRYPDARDAGTEAEDRQIEKEIRRRDPIPPEQKEKGVGG